MVHVILGLLLIRPMSQYDLMRAFDRTISLFYSSSPGSIRRALAQLSEREWIVVAATEPGRGRRVWHITESGEAEFRAWIQRPPQSGNEKELLTRVYFLGLVEPSQRGAVIAHVSEALEAQARRLADLDAAVEVPEELRDVERYQRATLALGRAQARQAIEWISGLS